MAKLLRFTLFFLTCSLLWICNQKAYADDLKVAVLNMQRVFADAPQFVAIHEKIAHQFSPRREECDLLQKKFQTDLDIYLSNQHKLKVVARKRARMKMLKAHEKLLKMQNDLERDLSAMQTALTDTLLKQIQNMFEDYAREQEINLTFYRDHVVYSRPELDISDDVLAALKNE